MAHKASTVAFNPLRLICRYDHAVEESVHRMSVKADTVVVSSMRPAAQWRMRPGKTRMHGDCAYYDRAVLAHEFVEQLKDTLGGSVQITCGLVSNNQRRLIEECSCNGQSLLFPPESSWGIL